MKLNFLITILLLASTAFAGTINFGDSDLVMSTDNTFIEITSPGISPSNIPNLSTFTLPFDPSLPGDLNAKWFLFEFVLPSNFSDLSMNIRLTVDNEAQIFLNGQIAAVEDDTVVANFQSPFPEFTLNSNNTVSEISGTWDSLPINQSMFQSGTNRLIFYATDNGGQGHFNLLNGTIEFNETPVPEPSSYLLLVFALAFAGHKFFRK